MIFHTTLYNLPVAPDPPAPRVPGRSGRRRNLPSHCPGAPVSGCAVANERGEDLRLEEHTCCARDTLAESPEPAPPLVWVTRAHPQPTLEQGGGEGSCSTQLELRLTRGPSGGSSSPLPLAGGWQGFPQAPAAPARAFAQPVGRGARLQVGCSSRGEQLPRRPPNHALSHPKQAQAAPAKRKQMGLAARLARTGARAAAPLHLQMISVI